ncbi:MAG TPA: BON domain-containing protein [Dyella sp.]|uniref:BON domain-containing protein n=1 Tax=Dyella sp. TaxID=1869338 RepID=UPI002D7989AE|nr:BON domain-containing protein [Dyella sp.]HET6553510.1 BON domain-containing protein [Dyella sp.]
MNSGCKLALSIAVATFCASAAIAQNAPVSSSTSGHAADNTAVNARDRSDASKTSDAQPNDKSDVKLVAAVRRALTKDSSLSVMAHNVKIIATGGTVTLRGPVKSDDEKTRIEGIVQSVSGVQRVDNELEVKP